MVFADGISLACGILKYLLNIEDAPKVIAATHFHEIFENNFLEPRPRLQLGHMEVKVCEEFQEVEDQVTYLYKFVKKNKSLACDRSRWLTDGTAFVWVAATRALVPCMSLVDGYPCALAC